MPSEVQKRLAAEGIRQLIAGIRPEHIQDPVKTSKGLDAGVSFRAPIDAIEWMGSDLFAYFSTEVDRGAYQATPYEIGNMAMEGGSVRCVVRLLFSGEVHACPHPGPLRAAPRPALDAHAPCEQDLLRWHGKPLPPPPRQ